MSVARWAIGCSTILLSTGCFGYVPATLDSVPVGAHVRAMLSTEGQIILRDRVGIDTQVLQGELLEHGGDVVLLAVRSGTISDEFGGQRPLFQRIDIPTSHILRVDLRRVDPVRTGALVGVGVGAAVLIIRQAFGKRNPGQVDNSGGGPDERITSWTSRLPFAIR